MPVKLKYNQVKDYIENKGYILLSKEYKNNSTKLEICCPKGHNFKMIFNSFQNGRRCPICFGKTKKTIDEVREYIESYNYKLLSKEYKNNCTKLSLQCPEGHKFNITWNNFHKGSRCPICAGNFKNIYHEVKNKIENKGYILLSKEYKNNSTKLEIKCDKGHIFYSSYNNLISKNSGCPICNFENRSSKAEKEIQQFISKIYNGQIKPNDRTTIINPPTGYNLELDVYLPELNKAIEFNGTYWHSLPINNDKIKLEQCKKKNIDLLIIKEENWSNDKDIELKKIKEFINV